MRRTTFQLAIVVLAAAAFVATTVSGLVLFAPANLLPVFGGSLGQWRTVHEWGAAGLVAAVVAHVVLHRRRFGQLLVTLWAPAGGARGGAAAPGDGAAAAPGDGAAAAPGDGAAAAPGAAAVAEGGGERSMRLNRRWFLFLGAGAVAAAVAALVFRSGGSRQTGSGAGLLADFPVLDVEGPPDRAAADWVVEVDGLVDTPLRLDRSAWLALPRTQETRTFHCVEGWSVDHLGWEGVRVSELLSRAGLQAGARFVTFHAYSGRYTDSLSLVEAQAPETLLADALDAAPLPAAHGGPLRLVIPSQLGYKNVKWVVRLEVTAQRAIGYWEATGGYAPEAPVS
jgi:DMSO/TMAO reductase YedYZ molybdopterin-dependent catalytic subunit